MTDLKASLKTAPRYSLGEWWREQGLRLQEAYEDYALGEANRFRRSLQRCNEDSALAEGKRRAQLAALRTWRQVPAYRAFLAQHGLSSPDVPFAHLPTMDKSNYIRAFPTDQRCIGGCYLSPGVAIDESSGSTGIPYNWVRGIHERRRMRYEMARMIDWAVGQQPRIAINGFSMGAWATGVNVGEALELHSVVKSTGPDLEKILHTLEFFGTDYGYFLCGYPPFLKRVLDGMLERRFPVEKYELHGLMGGEGMSEECRRYLLRHFRTVYSGYGASDLEMGIAVETPESIQIRGLINDHPDLRHKLLDGDHRVPMIFQFNPLMYHIETNERDELIVTLNYSRVLSPRVRYNIGDEGRVLRRSDLLATLREAGYPVNVDPAMTLPLPYLVLFGRRDQTISIMGANIYPEDLERVLYAQPELASGYASFSISVADCVDGAVYPRLCLEWTAASPPPLPLDDLALRIERQLMDINADFKNAMSEYAETLRFKLEVHGFGQGPFAERGRRIKNRYLTTEKMA
jgi:phenylacetate-CoA ligase